MGLFTPAAGIVIALVKAGLVILLFMELATSKPLIRLAAVGWRRLPGCPVRADVGRRSGPPCRRIARKVSPRRERFVSPGHGKSMLDRLSPCRSTASAGLHRRAAAEPRWTPESAKSCRGMRRRTRLPRNDRRGDDGNTVRSPDLAIGFSLTDGIIKDNGEIQGLKVDPGSRRHRIESMAGGR